MYKIALSEGERRFLSSLAGRYNNISYILGAPGLMGAMSNYTGQSYLRDAALSNIGSDALKGALVGGAGSAFLLPLIGSVKNVPLHYFKTGVLAGLGTGIGAGALTNVLKYYLGKGLTIDT